MKINRRSCWLFLLVSLIALSLGWLRIYFVTTVDRPSDSLAVESPSALQPQRRHALLIGCSVYPNLDKGLWLNGPSADVRITKDLLTYERFGFQSENIVDLVFENPPHAQPTYENIASHFERLISRIRRGDQVFILMAGHGGQKLNTNPDEDPEPDGLDEVFVPQDIQEWTPSHRSEDRKVILDDQIGNWLIRLREKGAHVFFVADSCHSGSLNRGIEESENLVRGRSLPLLYTSNNSTKPIDTITNSGVDSQNSMDIPADFVALYAVPAGFTAREQPMPPDGQVGAIGVHGRLSYAVNEVLRNARRSLSYRELVQQVRWKHVGWNWNPSPYAEGTELNRMVFGQALFPERSIITMTITNQTIQINMGSLNNILPGSVLAVYPPIGEPNDEVVTGYVKVISTEATCSQAELCSFGTQPIVQIQSLPKFGRCEFVYRELGDARIPILLVNSPNIPPSESHRAMVRTIVNIIFNDARYLVREAFSGDEAELIVELVGGDIQIRQKYELFNNPTTRRDSPSQCLTPFPIDENLKVELGNRLLMIARAVNLIRLAESEYSSPRLSLNTHESIGFQFMTHVREEGTEEYRLVDDPTSLQLHSGDQLRVMLANSGEFDLDVSALVVESGFAIKPLRMRTLAETGGTERLGEFENRIPIGIRSRLFEIKIDDSTVGVESMVLIAAPSVESLPTNFNYLQQEGVQTVSFMTTANRGSQVNRGQILDRTLYEGSSTRGPKAETPKIAIRRISWNVISGTRNAQKR